MKNPYEPPSDSSNLSEDDTTTRAREAKLMSTLGTAMLVSSISAQLLCFTLLLLHQELSYEWAGRMLLVAGYTILSAPLAHGILAARCSRNIRQEYRELIVAGGILVGITSSILLYLFSGKWALQLV